MEVFIVSTPTYSGNYKAILESLRAQSERHARACPHLRLKGWPDDASRSNALPYVP
jgi:hypothetical protein